MLQTISFQQNRSFRLFIIIISRLETLKEINKIEFELATDPAVEITTPVSLVGLECLLNIVRALGMGSCLSVDGNAHHHGTAHVAGGPVYASPAMTTVGKRKPVSRKRPSSSSSLHLTETEMSLHRIPDRLFLNGSSDVASLYSKQGKKGINQDAMIVWENFGSQKDATFCAVFDGHGPNGHMVAKKVRDCLPLKLNAQWELNSLKKDNFNSVSTSALEKTPLTSVDEEPSTQTDILGIENQKDVILKVKDSFHKAFKVMDKELKVHPHVECFSSGTTAVTVLKRGQDLVIGNVGDSRAVLGTRDKDDSLISIQLTTDLKPNLPKELERIMLCKGRVFALPNEPDVSRMWLPNCDSPGLAMARAFGDFCLKDYGLISIPDVSYRQITEKDEFVVLATDGVWDVLSNKEAVEIVASAPRSSAARTLVESAVRTWRYKYPTLKVDDCAVVCLFFDAKSDDSSSICATSKEGSVSSPEQVNVVKKLRENKGV